MSLINICKVFSWPTVIHSGSAIPLNWVGTYFVPGSMPGAGDTRINKKQLLPSESSWYLMEELIL